MTSHAFYADAENKTNRRIRRWYQENLLTVLHHAKERQARDVDASIALAEEFLRKLDEPLEKPAVVPLRELIPSKDDSLMKPIEPEVLNLLYGGTEKGAAKKYLKARNKKAPEDRYNFRLTTNWDYGWQQKQYRQRARDVNRARCAILRDTFYRKNNLAADPRHYSQPAGGEISVCSEYSCNFT
ncbi:protein ATP6V1FNB-like [Galleria mellonella]|uniref:Protein ATP6V1FNB-like n=1 Tax=Galleria mellonella TaxID=7137 RepID=A0A6J1X2C2_GALME|nr:protein ATP6V1FNB-like [Galleria mellonella]